MSLVILTLFVIWLFCAYNDVQHRSKKYLQNVSVLVYKNSIKCIKPEVFKKRTNITSSSFSYIEVIEWEKILKLLKYVSDIPTRIHPAITVKFYCLLRCSLWNLKCKNQSTFSACAWAFNLDFLFHCTNYQ